MQAVGHALEHGLGRPRHGVRSQVGVAERQHAGGQAELALGARDIAEHRERVQAAPRRGARNVAAARHLGGRDLLGAPVEGADHRQSAGQREHVVGIGRPASGGRALLLRRHPCDYRTNRALFGDIDCAASQPVHEGTLKTEAAALNLPLVLFLGWAAGPAAPQEPETRRHPTAAPAEKNKPVTRLEEMRRSAETRESLQDVRVMQPSASSWAHQVQTVWASNRANLNVVVQNALSQHIMIRGVGEAGILRQRPSRWAPWTT